MDTVAASHSTFHAMATARRVLHIMRNRNMKFLDVSFAHTSDGELLVRSYVQWDGYMRDPAAAHVLDLLEDADADAKAAVHHATMSRLSDICRGVGPSAFFCDTENTRRSPLISKEFHGTTELYIVRTESGQQTDEEFFHCMRSSSRIRFCQFIVSPGLTSADTWSIFNARMGSGADLDAWKSSVLEKQAELWLAFFMGTHARLGADSAVRLIKEDLAFAIFSTYGWLDGPFLC